MRWRAWAALAVGLVVLLYFVDGALPGLFARDLGPVDRVVVEKSGRRMTLYAGDEPVATYRSKQNLSSLDLAGGALAAAHQSLKLPPFLGTQRDAIAYVHGDL
jgi:hypothetical protein